MALSGLGALNLSQPLASALGSAQLRPTGAEGELRPPQDALIEDTTARVLEGIERMEKALKEARSLEDGVDESLLAEDAFLKELLAQAQEPHAEDIVHKGHRHHDEDDYEEEDREEMKHGKDGHQHGHGHGHGNHSEHHGGGHHHEIPAVRCCGLIGKFESCSEVQI